jgi:hypothetical protein
MKMVTKTRKTRQKSEWDKLPKREQRRLLDDYMGRVLRGLPSKRIAEKIARLKGIAYRKSPGSKVVRFT